MILSRIPFTLPETILGSFMKETGYNIKIHSYRCHINESLPERIGYILGKSSRKPCQNVNVLPLHRPAESVLTTLKQMPHASTWSPP